MKKFIILRSSIFLLCVCFVVSALAAEDLKPSEKVRRSQEIKSLYRKAIGDYKHDRLHESQKAFEKILTLDSHQRKAVNFLENKIPRKFVEREAKKQEHLRVEALRSSYMKKKMDRQSGLKVEGEASPDGFKKRHHDGARSLFVNEDDVSS
ncbi:MAG: hypothetical protein ABIC68_07660 [Candidatus Omnitrophota bacterium]